VVPLAKQSACFIQHQSLLKTIAVLFSESSVHVKIRLQGESF